MLLTEINFEDSLRYALYEDSNMISAIKKVNLRYVTKSELKPCQIKNIGMHLLRNHTKYIFEAHF